MAGDNASSGKHPCCDACNNAITSKTVLIQTCCKHIFHKDCLSACMKTRPFCPVCDTRIVNEAPAVGAPSVLTRSKPTDPSVKQQTGVLNASFRVPPSSQTEQTSEIDGACGFDTSLFSVPPPNVSTLDMGALKDMITSIVASQQAHLFSALNSQIADMQSNLSRLSTNTSNIVASSQQNAAQLPPQTNITPPHMHTVSHVEQEAFRDL